MKEHRKSRCLQSPPSGLSLSSPFFTLSRRAGEGGVRVGTPARRGAPCCRTSPMQRPQTTEGGALAGALRHTCAVTAALKNRSGKPSRNSTRSANTPGTGGSGNAS